MTDIDGCILPRKGGLLDWQIIRLFHDYNAATAALGRPGIVLCTGRSATFVEALGNALGIRQGISVCEAGAVLYDHATDREIISSAIPAGHAQRLQAVRAQLLTTLQPQYGIDFEPGKSYVLSMVIPDRSQLGVIHEQVGRLVDPQFFAVTRSATTVEVIPAGVHKGIGVLDACRLMAIELQQVIGIGDSETDQHFLELLPVAQRACPANATPLISALCGYRSALSCQENAFLDIVGHYAPYLPVHLSSA